jgi:uncharacterized protein with HEPN domain
MSDQTTKRLLDALAACDAIKSFLAGRSVQEYNEDFGLRLQIERLLEIIGEALNQATAGDDTLRHTLPELGEIIGMRNRIIHGYDVIDNELIWSTATFRVPELRSQLESILNHRQPI